MQTHLRQLAADLWWTGQPDAQLLWRDLDPIRWEESLHNPVALLADMDLAHAPAGWAERAQDLLDRWEAYQAQPIQPDAPRTAYFCMEFGLHECLPIYAGGLGILAGDHLRSAADLRLPMVAVGLLYHEGYFKQLIHDGRQVAAYVPNLTDRLPMRPVLGPDDKPLEIPIPHGNHTYPARAWVVQVGCVQLYLLDTDFEGNPPQHACLTKQLYGGSVENRLCQEVLLGIGGVRLLKAVGFEPEVYHMNEGHSAFLTLELWAQGLREGQSVRDAWHAAKQRCVFTTHTPVPAGHDRFSWELVNPVLEGYRQELDLPEGAFMDRGRVVPGDVREPLCMTTLALRASRSANGVSALHGEVSREMWKDLGIPIHHITNGVHPTAWLAPETAELFDAHLPGWNEAFDDPSFWERAHQIPTEALLELRRQLRSRLVSELRRKLGIDVLDPDKLTVGFARRFAPYKRATLLFSDADRLAALLDRGAQVVFAGKAHPQDLHGQAILAEVVRWSRNPRFRGRVVFVPDYDASTGRLLTQGADLWLNTPRRPHEASGTSGQKASLNGNPNCSVLDGWWPEAYDGDNGWTVGDTRTWDRPEDQDAHDAEALYNVLEEKVLPAFSDADGWARCMGHVLATCVPRFNTHRMVGDYLRAHYKGEGFEL